MGSFSENVLPLIETSMDDTVDDTVEPEIPDDNDVIEDNIDVDQTDDELNDDSDMPDTATDWNDNAISDLENIAEVLSTTEESTEPIIVNDETVDTDMNDGYDGGYEDEYNYGDFKVHFISISILLLTIAV